MNPATIATNVLKSKWTWIAIAILLLWVFARPAMASAWAKLMRRDLGNYNQIPGTEPLTNPYNPRIATLQQLAEELFAAMNGLPSFFDQRPELFAQANAINDTELKYLADYYKQVSGGETLRTAVANEWSALGDSGDLLVARLLKLDL